MQSSKKEIGDGESRCSFDEMSTLSFKTKKPLNEKIDEIQTLLNFTEVAKERRILKNREIALLREFYTSYKHLAGVSNFNQTDQLLVDKRDLAKENVRL